jgi:Phage T4 tail fibre
LSRISVANLAKPVVSNTPAAGSDSDWFSTTTNLPSTNINADIYTLGNVGIGTKKPDARLTVKGIIHTDEVKVDLDVPADYVFQKYFTGNSALKPTYKMPNLAQLEAYIKQNHHLPQMPSAADIKTNGLELGKMNNLLLEKVEELTLYTIEQQKQLQNQAQLIEKLNQRLQQLEKAKP